MEAGVADDIAAGDEWELHHDEDSGQAYYVNLRTGESAWHPPVVEPVVLTADDVAISHKWTEATDANGRVYYVNLQTLETVWDPPPGYHSTTASSSIVARGSHRPSTAEEMDQLNALLSGGDADGKEEEEEEEEEKNASGSVASAGNEGNASTVVDDGSEWMMFLNETDGLPYYYNHITGECVWEAPASFLEYHARLTEGIEIRSPELPSEDAAESDRVTVPLLSQFPPVPITPEFEDKVRRAIETLSKTPVGSSRVLLVRTPTVKSIDTGRSNSRPPSSSGVSARQRSGTARIVTEVEEATPISSGKMEGESLTAGELSVNSEFFNVQRDPGTQNATSEDTKLIQREQLMQQLALDEMALVIQCLVRCFLARARVARKRKERHRLVDVGVVEENNKDWQREMVAPHFDGLEKGDRAENGQSNLHEVAQEPPPLSLERAPPSLGEQPQTLSCVQEQEQDQYQPEEPSEEPTLPVAFGDGTHPPDAEETEQSPRNSLRLDSQEDSDLNPSDSPTTLQEQDSAVVPYEEPIIEGLRIAIVEETKSDLLTGEPSQNQIGSTITADDGFDRTVQGPERNSSVGENRTDNAEVTPSPPAWGSDLESVGENAFSQAVINDAHRCEEPQPSPSRTSAREISSTRCKDDRPTARQPVTRESCIRLVDMVTGPLAILNVSTFFPQRAPQAPSEATSLKMQIINASSTSAGIQRKPIQAGQRLSHRKTPEQRAAERSAQVHAAEQAREKNRQTRTEEAKQLRQLFAESALRSSSEFEQLRATELVRRHAAESEQQRWLSGEAVKAASSQRVSKLRSSLWTTEFGWPQGDTAKAQIESAIQPKGFIESMMRKRLNEIDRIVHRLKHELVQTAENSSLLAYWEDKVQTFRSSVDVGTRISDPYWCKLYEKLQRVVSSGSNLAQEHGRSRSDNYDSILHVAAWNGQIDFVHFLIADLLFDVNMIDSSATKTTPLHEACRAGHAEVVDLLLYSGAFLDAVDAQGETALHIACRLGWTQVVHRLVAAGETQDERDHIMSAGTASDESETQVSHPRVLRSLTWEQCFFLRNCKGKRAVDVAKLPSITEFLMNYSSDLHDPEDLAKRATSASSSNVVAKRSIKGTVKKKKVRDGLGLLPSSGPCRWEQQPRHSQSTRDD